MKKPETKFKERVAKDLKLLPNCWFVKTRETSIRGIPDYLICLNEKFIAIELKATKKGYRNPLQEWTLEAISAAGGLSFLAYPENWKNTLDVLKELAGEVMELVPAGKTH